MRSREYGRRELLRMASVSAALLGPGFRGLWGTSAAAAVRPAAPAAATGKRWNIITILTDDQAIWGMGAYGNSEIRTPVLDRLAREGALFTNAFAATGVCTPSRVAYTTGRHSIELGVLNDAVDSAQMRDQGLPRNTPTWARELQRAGYRTALIGKWHLGSMPEFFPTRFGYDYFYGFVGGSNRPKNPGLTRDGNIRIAPGFTEDLLVDDAMDWLERNAAEPFSLSIHFRAPHLPYGPVPDADLEAVKGIDPTVPKLSDGGIEGASELYTRHLKKERLEYYAAIHCIDRNVGRLLQKLDALGLSGNTIVMFTSDQGYLLGERGLFNKGAAAPIQYGMFPDNRLLWVINMYDLALRVPLLVRWPGVVPPGTVIDDLVSLIDIYPTVLGMTGVPQRARIAHDARDFSPLLRGEKVAWRDMLFGQYTSDQLGNLEFLRMVRTRKWKMVRAYMNPPANQLFDLESDPDELKNLYYPPSGYDIRPDGSVAMTFGSDTYAGQKQMLQAHLEEWQRRIDDPALTLDRDYRRALEVRRRRFT